MRIWHFCICLFLICSSSEVFAQHMHMSAQHSGMSEEKNGASQFLLSEAAGTGVNPASTVSHMLMMEKNGWTLMAHGFAFLNIMEQSGPRGEDRVFSTNHVMFIGEHPLNEKSALVLRGMVSLEPATVTKRYYPELFQTGETAFGKAIVDGQHPHDFIMELSVQYALQLNPDTLIHFYAAPVGDPAIGPVAYPHRVSAEELPQAPLSHHWQDSTHIAYNVFTAGLKYKIVRGEASAFHGAEPDEHRWNIDSGAIDSWSGRITVTPHPDWAAQVSTARLKKPEELEPGNVQRTTTSITYNRNFEDGMWASTFVFGHNHKLAERTTTNGFNFETLYQFQHLNYVTGRVESVDKDELFANNPEIEEHFAALGKSSFKINAFTFGYARDLNFPQGWGSGIGANFTFYSFPSELKPFYSSSPKSFLIYMRVRPGHSNH